MSIAYLVLTPKHWAQMMELVNQSKTRGNAPYLNLQDEHFYKRFFEGEGIAIGAFEEDRLIGFALLGFEPFLSEIWEPYLEKMAIPRAQAAVLIHILLAPNQRNKGLGKALTSYRMELAKKLGRWHLFATVSPENLPIQNILKHNEFTILERKKLYTKQLDRYLMYGKIAQGKSEDAKRIVLIDSGFGGLNVGASLQQIAQSYESSSTPQHLYYINASPSNERGYNQMSTQEEQLEVFGSVLKAIQAQLMPQAIYIACNTLSVLLPFLPKELTHENSIIGIIESGVLQMVDFQKQNPESPIVLLATETTIRSGIYLEKVAKMGADRSRILSIAAPNLATTISNDQTGKEVASLIEKLIEPHIEELAKSFHKVGVFLGCTHYGYRTELFVKAFERYGVATQILDPNFAFAHKIAKHANIQTSFSKVYFFSRYALPQSELANISAMLHKRVPLLSKAVLDYKLDFF